MLVQRKRPAGMLLNQCLAISLSPCGAEAREFARTSGRDDERVCDDERRVEPRKRCSEVSLFRQLIERNCPANENPEDAEENNEPRNGKIATQLDERKQSQLREALSRVEFAGFVVPSWLLLSGSYNDLHCIKTSWSEGQLRPPAGFKIETIGKFPRKARSRRLAGPKFFSYQRLKLTDRVEHQRAAGEP